MNWLKQAVSSVEAKLQESGVSQKLADMGEKIAPVASVASSNARSLISQLSTTIETGLPNPKSLLSGRWSPQIYIQFGKILAQSCMLAIVSNLLYFHKV
jgi:hypothetical protein